MFKFVKAFEEYLNPKPPPANPEINWDVDPQEIHRVAWAYAHLANCSYYEAIDQLFYMTYEEAKEFLGES